MSNQQKRHPVREAKTISDKMKAFWEYYKVPALIACIAILFVGYGVYDILSTPKQPTADFYVIAMTREELTDTQKQELEEGVKQSFSVKDGENPTVEVIYHVYAQEDAAIKEESGGNEGYATTIQSAANQTVQLENAEKTAAIYIYDSAYLEFLNDEESYVDLSTEYSDVSGIEGESFSLKTSKLFQDSSLPDDLQMRVKKESQLDTSAESYAWQKEAVENLISGNEVRTQEQVEQADAQYQQAMEEYSNS
mgnify:FL=1